MALEIVIYGVVLVWLVGLLPAAIVTCLKGHWAMFAAGLLTLGLVWFLGALAAAELDSTWARRRYGEKERARISGDARHRRPWRTLGITAAVALVAIVVLGTFGARPAPVLGVNGGALEHSVGGSPLFEPPACKRIDGGEWICSHWDDQFSSTVGYRVEVGSLGCWHAVRAGPAGEGIAKRLSGCVALSDYF
jgi:hypothetical protein